MDSFLLERWRGVYDALNARTAEIDAQIEALRQERNKIAAPYEERLGDLCSEIREQALEGGAGETAYGVQVSYRSGYTRVSYDKNKVDAVLGVLKDVLPETASTLEKARRESEVAPSVSIRAV